MIESKAWKQQILFLLKVVDGTVSVMLPTIDWKMFFFLGMQII